MPGKVVQIDVKNPMIIAPCGINCSLCRAYIRDSKPCVGCRGGDSNKSNACLTCSIMNCMKLAAGNHQFCFSCTNFPCAELTRLDHRYRTKYGVSVIANLESIKYVGVKRFILEETDKWTCPECGLRLCMHKPQCVNCGYEKQVKLF
jgi:hypothetical protein